MDKKWQNEKDKINFICFFFNKIVVILKRLFVLNTPTKL